MVSSKLPELGMKDFIVTWYKLVFKEQMITTIYIKEGPYKKIILVEIFVDDTLSIGNDDLWKKFLVEMGK